MRPILQAREVSLVFDGVRAIDRLTLEILQPEVTALIGPNGAGKTTFFNVVTGFLTASHGRILFKDQEITGWRADRVARQGIARTFQDLRLIMGLSTLDNVMLATPSQTGESCFGAVVKKRAWLDEEGRNCKAALQILCRVGLQGHERELARNLSYGQQKLLTLACCLHTGAELLLLDEPFAAIHPTLIDALILLIRELASEGKTILFIEHNIDAVRRLADKVFVMARGAKVAEGHPLEVLSKPEVLDIYLR